MLSLGSYKFIINAAYFPPLSPPFLYENFMSLLETTYQQHPEHTFLLCGDYNLPDISWSNDSHGLTYNSSSPLRVPCVPELLAFNGFYQKNSVLNSKGSILDLICCNTDSVIVCESLEPFVPPDLYHPPLNISLHIISTSTTLNNSHSFHNFKKADYNCIIHFLSSYDWASTLSNLDLNTSVNTFTDSLHSSILRFVPLSHFYKSTFPSWVSKDLKTLVYRKNKAHAKFKSTFDPADYRIFSLLRAKCKYMSKKCHKTFVEQSEKSLSLNPKKFWDFVRRNRSHNAVPNIVSFDGVDSSCIQESVTNLVFEYIVEEMRPMVTCEKPAFRRLIKGLSGITEYVSLPDRQVLLKELKLKYLSYSLVLTKLISEHNFICTTADIWSCNNKSYLGMTCHFINENTFNRSSYVLGCRRIKGSHTYDNIAEIINEITQTYKIDNSKISHTVTDNASKFGKAFRIFSCQTVVPTHSNSSKYELEKNWFGSDDSGSDNSDDEVEVEIITMDSILTPENYSNEYSLPEHMTCTAHTLNLIATVDISKISNLSYNKISTATFKKLNSFWNLLSRSTVASDKVEDKCNCKFPIPIITRWNSMFFAAKKVVSHKDKLVSIFDDLKLSKLSLIEWTFLEEYCCVMEPLAISLDKLQGDKTCFLGYVIPTIIALRLKLLNLTILVYCRPLSLLIVISLEKRFPFVFNLDMSKTKLIYCHQ
ncbi:hypothetical protein ACI65C_013400 [Semiaphis heraclei]